MVARKGPLYEEGGFSAAAGIGGSYYHSKRNPPGGMGRPAGLRIETVFRPGLCQMTESPIFFNCSCNLSAISAINSELVGFPFVFETVYPKNR